MGEIVGSEAGQQRFAALERANLVRLARADLKRRICTGNLSASEVLEECPWPAYKMPVDEVLMSQKRWGTQRCRRLLVPLGIPENKEIGTLTERQRTLLVTSLAGKKERPGRPPEASARSLRQDARRPAAASGTPRKRALSTV